MRHRPSPVLVIKDLDDGTVVRTNVRAFCRANREAFDGDLCRQARQLGPGQSFTGGGGASPAFRVTRPRRR